MANDQDVLVSLNIDELEALADSQLAPSSQARLDELLVENAKRQLNEQENQLLDTLLSRVDQLTILKTRARYTLRQQAQAAPQGRQR